MIVKSINNDNRTYILIHSYDCEEKFFFKKSGKRKFHLRW